MKTDHNSKKIWLLVALISSVLSNFSLNAADDIEILDASYGDQISRDSKRRKNITESVRNSIKANKLELAAGSANRMFGDPAFGTHKAVMILYRHDSELFLSITSENEPVVIPSSSAIAIGTINASDDKKEMIVLRALYGDLNYVDIGKGGKNRNVIIDVTDAMNKLVKDNKIVLSAGHNNLFKGYVRDGVVLKDGDPVFGIEKAIWVVFSQVSIDGTALDLYLQIVNENQAATISHDNAEKIYTIVLAQPVKNEKKPGVATPTTVPEKQSIKEKLPDAAEQTAEEPVVEISAQLKPKIKKLTRAKTKTTGSAAKTSGKDSVEAPTKKDIANNSIDTTTTEIEQTKTETNTQEKIKEKTEKPIASKVVAPKKLKLKSTRGSSRFQQAAPVRDSEKKEADAAQLPQEDAIESAG